MTKKRISVQSAKAKGRNLQKWIATKISEALDIPCGKDEQIESRPMGSSGTDIILHGEAKTRFKFSIEAKAQESWSVHSWIEQAKANQLPNTDWLLIAKKSRNKPVVIMDAEVFFNIFARTINHD